MSAKNTTALLQNLRGLMSTASYVNPPVHAYVIPRGDAHQVLIFVFYLILFLYYFLLLHLYCTCSSCTDISYCYF